MARIKVKRGPEANIGNITLDDGEFAVTTDTKKLYVGLAGAKICIGAASSLGDMLKSIYDTDNDGIVDSAENSDMLDGKHASDFAPSGYGLGGLCRSVTGDWNSYTDTGFYMGSNLTNSPPVTNGSNTWWYVLIMTHNTSPGWTLQLATDFNNKATYKRARINGVWGSWVELLAANSAVTWDHLKGV